MALPSNPDQDFSAGYGKDPELENWRAYPPASFDELFVDQLIRERVGRLIARAIKSTSARTPGH